ncbi:hypothetical protein JVT61DRAFT_768 [Boletus reticuloceps]|uniref:Uncharacterized protein n=1 Tax=Boletus reticuloceps TaxID=495285 RepID=A0A8I2Z1M4_9AGAM|nr:hypothetical protein JVT61DRAFT_768 [Boletus reticuloceps]
MWFCAYSGHPSAEPVTNSRLSLCHFHPLTLPTSRLFHPHPPHLCLPHPPLAYLPLPSSGPQGLTSALPTCPSSILGHSHLPTSGHHPAFLTFELLVPFPLPTSGPFLWPSYLFPLLAFFPVGTIYHSSLPTSGILPSPLVPPWPILPLALFLLLPLRPSVPVTFCLALTRTSQTLDEIQMQEQTTAEGWIAHALSLVVP